MKKTDLQKTIENFWDDKESINPSNKNLTKTINVVLDQLDRGIIRICEKYSQKSIELYYDNVFRELLE